MDVKIKYRDWLKKNITFKMFQEFLDCEEGEDKEVEICEKLGIGFPPDLCVYMVDAAKLNGWDYPGVDLSEDYFQDLDMEVIYNMPLSESEKLDSFGDLKQPKIPVTVEEKGETEEEYEARTEFLML